MTRTSNTALKLGGLALLVFAFSKSGSAKNQVTTKHGAVNNPGNIRTEAKLYPGEIVSPSNAFLSFLTLADGYAAMVIKIRSYFSDGYTTLREIINHWAPASDGNDPDSYIQYILDNVAPGIIDDADTDVHVADDGTMMALIALMSDIEQGSGFGTAHWNDVVAAFNNA
jgi:hypothetical protein